MWFKRALKESRLFRAVHYDSKRDCFVSFTTVHLCLSSPHPFRWRYIFNVFCQVLVSQAQPKPRFLPESCLWLIKKEWSKVTKTSATGQLSLQSPKPLCLLKGGGGPLKDPVHNEEEIISLGWSHVNLSSSEHARTPPFQGSTSANLYSVISLNLGQAETPGCSLTCVPVRGPRWRPAEDPCPHSRCSSGVAGTCQRRGPGPMSHTDGSWQCRYPSFPSQGEAHKHTEQKRGSLYWARPNWVEGK